MDRQWWHGKTAYQIYPKSFKDGNGDGIGDLRGIIDKLNYIKQLGIDILWLSPIYRSPFIDNGYDISDYQDIDPQFGNMDDFDELMTKAHDLNIKVIMDLVVNHCSSEHEWFKKACADPYCEEASYFYFREGKDGRAPNNLRSNFGGSVWDKVPGQENLYYCHFFAREQPDLNWFNPRLRQRIYDLINWWLDKGIAGFRIDAIMSIAKDPDFPDYPPDALGDGLCACGAMNESCNDVAELFLKELQEEVFRPRQTFTVGEVFSIQPENIEKYIGNKGNFSTIFDFEARTALCHHCAYYAYEKLSVAEFRDALFKAQQLSNEHGFLATVLENHDEPRALSCWLPAMWQNPMGAKALGTIQLLLRGIPFVYQGQELGMGNTHFNSIYEMKDLQSFEEYRRCLNHGLTDSVALGVLNAQARDHARTPMPWDNSLNAGFSTSTPWMRLQQDYQQINVKSEEQDRCSVLWHYRQLISLRHNDNFKETITYGRFEPQPNPNRHTIAFRRVTDKQCLLVASNFGENPVWLDCGWQARTLLSSGEHQLKDGHLILEAGASAVIQIY